MRYGHNSKRYRISCRPNRKICRRKRGAGSAFSHPDSPLRFYFKGRRTSRYWRQNSRCRMSVQKIVEPHPPTWTSAGRQAKGGFVVWGAEWLKAILRLKPRCSLFAARMYPRYNNEICSTLAKIAKTQRHDVQINIGKQTLKLG